MTPQERETINKTVNTMSDSTLEYFVQILRRKKEVALSTTREKLIQEWIVPPVIKNMERETIQAMKDFNTALRKLSVRLVSGCTELEEAVTKCQKVIKEITK